MGKDAVCDVVAKLVETELDIHFDVASPITVVAVQKLLNKVPRADKVSDNVPKVKIVALYRIRSSEVSVVGMHFDGAHQ